MLGGPFQNQRERAPGHSSAQDSQRLDANDRLEFAVTGVEVRRFMFAPVHSHYDTEKRADRGDLTFCVRSYGFALKSSSTPAAGSYAAAAGLPLISLSRSAFT